MADKNIGMLPQVPQLDDESLMVVEQQGTAMKMTGRQFKDFGKTGLQEEFQDYVDEARQAAEEAAGAVKAVTDMTVSAGTLESGESATVRKTMQNGVYHLSFGLPRGERGEPGPEGKRGPAGPPGTGLKILGYYDTPAALEAAQPNPSPGDAYGVGAEAPYDIYVFDGSTGQWKNHGPLTSGGGSVLPENVVTAEGGGSLEFGEELGEAPHVITFDGEEEPPLTAEDIQFSETETVKEAIDGLFTSVSNGKQAVASAITDMGVPTEEDAAFSELAENIRKITGGMDTSDATAEPGDILSGKTAYTAAGKVEGIIPTLAAQTIVPGTASRTIAGGQYLGGTQTIQGDTNLVSANIRKGVSLFGVAGSMTSEFKATLTVKADTGAVVTAKCGDTEVSALSTNGSVVLELPVEGEWTVTAVRGVAQYNSVVVSVSSHYSAELTAEVHIEYFGAITSLRQGRAGIAGISAGKYALFGGGGGAYNPSSVYQTVFDYVEAYDQNLTQSQLDGLRQRRTYLAGVYNSGYALFGGGYLGQEDVSRTADAYNQEKVHTTPTDLSKKRQEMGAAAIGEYSLFGGGKDHSYSSAYADVDAYNKELVRTTPTILAQPGAAAAASNENYAIFGAKSSATAYNKQLTRTIPVKLKSESLNFVAVRAGNFVLFIGNIGLINDPRAIGVDAYDLFLTKTNPESLPATTIIASATNIMDFAVAVGRQHSLNKNVAYVYDAYLTRTTPDPINNEYPSAAASVEKYALFGGGAVNTLTGSYTASVEAYRYI